MLIKIEDISEPHWSNQSRRSLAKTHPHLVSQWVVSKNCGFTAADFSAGSGVQAWWRCPSNRKHIWQAAIYSRTNGEGCPFCDGKVVTKMTSLARVFPAVAADWHPKLNKGLSPETVSAGSNRNVWWRCKTCKHEWQTTISNRTTHGSGCYKCVRNIVDLSQKEYKYCFAYFDKKKNKGIEPTWVPTRAKIDWRCPENPSHVWQNKVVKPKYSPIFCPFCRGARLTEKEKAKVRKLFVSGVPILQIAQAVEATKHAVYEFLAKEKLHVTKSFIQRKNRSK